MKKSVRLPAFAKVNLCLHVLGRRPDGYHELRTLFQSISLHDVLELSRKRGGGIELEVAPDPIAPVYPGRRRGASLFTPIREGPASDEHSSSQVRRSRPDSRSRFKEILPGQTQKSARVFRSSVNLARQMPAETPLGDAQCKPALPTGRENLVWRAIEAMRRELNYRGGIHARLTKQIPIARGLGGGSSDAATAIIAMLHLTGRKLPLSRAMEIGAQLGADVPFFLFGGRALGVGRGDELYPLPDGPKYSVVVVSPNGIAVSTRDAYRWLSSELTKHPSPRKISRFCALCWSRQEAPLANDFEGPVFRRHPRLRAIRRALLRQGAAGAALAGSGSAVFGLFRSPAQARRSAFGFPEDQVFVVETIDRQNYARIMHPRFV